MCKYLWDLHFPRVKQWQILLFLFYLFFTYIDFSALCHVQWMHDWTGVELHSLSVLNKHRKVPFHRLAFELGMAQHCLKFTVHYNTFFMLWFFHGKSLGKYTILITLFYVENSILKCNIQFWKKAVYLKTVFRRWIQWPLKSKAQSTVHT